VRVALLHATVPAGKVGRLADRAAAAAAAAATAAAWATVVNAIDPSASASRGGGKYAGNAGRKVRHFPISIVT